MYTGEVEETRDPKMALNIYNPRSGWNITGSIAKEGLEELHRDGEGERTSWLGRAQEFFLGGGATM